MPDLVGRYTYKAAWGHLTGALMLRQLAYETVGANAIDDSSYDVAGSFSGRYNFNPNNDLRFAINVGSGIGRYVGLGIASDAMLDGNGNIDGIDGVAGCITASITPSIRSCAATSITRPRNTTTMRRSPAGRSPSRSVRSRRT